LTFVHHVCHLLYFSRWPRSDFLPPCSRHSVLTP
jgi:hypothetical protein